MSTVTRHAFWSICLSMPRALQMLIDGTFEDVQADAAPSFDPKEMRDMLLQMEKQEGLLNFTQAATLLGVSQQRVSQLVRDGILTRFSFCGHHYVSMKEVRARRESDVKGGRPKRSVTQRVAVSVKAALQTDRVQAKQGGYAGHKRGRK